MTSFKMTVCIKVWINFFKILLFCIPMQLIHFHCVNGFLNWIKEIIWQTEAINRCPLKNLQLTEQSSHCDPWWGIHCTAILFCFWALQTIINFLLHTLPVSPINLLLVGRHWIYIMHTFISVCSCKKKNKTFFCWFRTISFVYFGNCKHTYVTMHKRFKRKSCLCQMQLKSG